jgi:hypothetical protein
MNTYHTSMQPQEVWVRDEVYVVESLRFIDRNNTRHKITSVELDSNKSYTMDNIEQVSVIDHKGSEHLLNSSDHFEDIKTIKIRFTKSYIESCETKHIVSGVYYPYCDCCVEHFDMEKHEFEDIGDDIERYTVKDEYVTHMVKVPSLRLTIAY